MDKTAETVRVYDLCAEAYERQFGDLALDKDSVLRFAALLRPGDEVLDLACGPGTIAGLLFACIPGLRLQGIDLSRQMISLARKNAPEGQFQVGDIRDVHFPAGRFDGVVAAFCLPYLYDAEATCLIETIGRLLKPGGVLYLSCMEGTGAGFEETSFTPGHQLFMNYFSEEFVEGNLRECGLALEERMRQDYLEEDGSTSIDLIYIARRAQ